MLENTRVTVLTVFELLRENQQGEKLAPLPPAPPPKHTHTHTHKHKRKHKTILGLK